MEELSHLEEFLAIPSVSTQESRQSECLLAAKWLVKYLKSNGIRDSRLLDSPGLPLVYAYVPSVRKNAPTLLFYGHYDVQSEGVVAEWETPPFSPRYKHGKLVARGAADDKGQVITFIDGLVAALKSTNGDLAYNVKILIEGEEEIGSPHMPKIVADNAELLACDVVFVCDTDMAPESPRIYLGLRGISIFTLEITNSHTDIHSGTFGGAVSNPVAALLQACSQLVDQQGKVTIPGFYDGVEEPNLFERKTVAEVKPSSAEITKMTGAKALIHNPKYTVQEMSSLRPTLEFNAIHAGTDIPIVSTVIPRSAAIRISCRLVPNQDPKHIYELVSNYLAQLIPSEFNSYLTYLGGNEAVRYHHESEHIARAVRIAGKVWKNKPSFDYAGGSIGVLPAFNKYLGVEALLLGFAYDDANIHGANENYPVEQYFNGREFVHLLLSAD